MSCTAEPWHPAALHLLACQMLGDVLCLCTAFVTRLAETLDWVNLVCLGTACC